MKMKTGSEDLGRVFDYLDLSRKDGKTLKCKGGNKQCGNRCVPSTAKCSNEGESHKGMEKVFGNKDDWAVNPKMPLLYKNYSPGSMLRRGAAGAAVGLGVAGVAAGLEAASKNQQKNKGK